MLQKIESFVRSAIEKKDCQYVNVLIINQ